MVLCLFTTTPSSVVEGGAFLKAPSGMLNAENVAKELDAALEEALGAGHGQVDMKMEERRARILPMFESMPKLNPANGTVSREAVQYMVHRYFGQAHGWSIRGFEPTARDP